MSIDGKDLYRVIDDHFVFPSSRFITFDSQIKKNVHSLSSDTATSQPSERAFISRLYGFSRDEFPLAMRKGHTSALVMMDFKCEVPLFSRQRLGNEIVKIGLESNESRSSLE